MVKTDKLWINGAILRNDEADMLLQEFAEKTGITGRDFRHMRLLTEETLGMVHQMLKNFEGEIWLEETQDGYAIILEADVQAGREENQDQPGAAAGFMGKIAEMLNCSYMFENAEEMPEHLAETLPDYMSYGIPADRGAPVWAGKWSLSAYRQNLERRKHDPDAGIVTEELEKSIVAQLAKEVTIGIHGRKIRLVING